MYVEATSNNHGRNVFVSFERTDFILISIITFLYNRYPILNNDSLKARSGFRIHLLLEDNTWRTRHSTPKNDRYSNSSTDWTKLSLSFTEKKFWY